MSHSSLQTVPHSSRNKISTRPSLSDGPPINRMGTSTGVSVNWPEHKYVVKITFDNLVMQKNSNAKAKIGIHKIKQRNRSQLLLQLLYTMCILHIAWLHCTHCLATNITVIPTPAVPPGPIPVPHTIATMNTKPHSRYFNVWNSKPLARSYVQIHTQTDTFVYANILYMQTYVCIHKHPVCINKQTMNT